MVGQCYLERQTAYLKVVPQDYVRITSGLGEATPNTLIIVPMISNGVVEGVMEFASFKEFEPYQISFLEKVGESIASSIHAASVNERVKNLLSESQQQAEEMRAQEEEMRQNMEELAATQEEMGRQTNKMSDQIRAMNNGNLAIAEFDIQGNIVEANTVFLKVMNYQLHEVEGHHHRMFVEPKYAGSETYAAFWQSLREGKAQTGLIHRIGKFGKKVVLAATYLPVTDDKGSVYRVIKYALDMTDLHANGKEALTKTKDTISLA
jgi:methyl-accepting chemotaxis protein